MTQGDPALAPATRATYVVFGGLGFALANWASRIPQIKAQLGLDPATLGLVLLGVASGSIVALPLSGPVIARLGVRATARAAAAIAGGSLLLVAVSSRVSVGLVFIGLVALGLATGNWDVAMNVHGAEVERRLGRSVLARFHAGFSLGTVLGALTGAAMIALGVSVAVHLAAVGLLVGTIVPTRVGKFLPDADADAGPAATETDSPFSTLTAWRERRALLIGVVVVAFTLAEGTGNDWISVSVIGAHHVAPAIATLAYASFLLAMTSGRWFGPGLLDRYGRVPVLRCSAVIAITGLALFVLAAPLILVFLGVLLWGTGASLGFPVGISAAADDPARGPARVSVVSSIGFLGFLGGPPIVGLLGQGIGVTHALSVVIAALIPAAVIASVVRSPPLGAAQAAAGSASVSQEGV